MSNNFEIMELNMIQTPFLNPYWVVSRIKSIQIILGLTRQFYLRKNLKNQNFSLSRLTQKWININFRNQRNCGKPFLMIFGQFRTKSLILKKKFPKICQNSKKCYIFEI